jgi:peptidyl-dipeptidase Dcp
MTATNPFFDQNLSFPPYDTAQPEHFKEALESSFAKVKEEFVSIRDNGDAATFENTALRLEGLFSEVSRIFGVLGDFGGNKSSDEIIEVSEWADLEFDKLNKEIFQDQKLAGRFKAVYDQRSTLGLDEEDTTMLQSLYESFEDTASFLSADGQEAVNKIDQRLIELTTAFNVNMKKGATQNALLFTDPRDMEGVPESEAQSLADNAAKVIAALALDADEATRAFLENIPEDIIGTIAAKSDEGKLDECRLFFPERLLIDSLLEVAESRSFRKAIAASIDLVGTKDPYDNRPLIEEIQKLRSERIALINEARPEAEQYRHYADYAQSKSMLGSYDRIEALMTQVEAPLIAKYEEDMKALQAYVDGIGGPEAMEPYDVPYYTALYKKEVLGYDAAEFSEYFTLENVKKGFFAHVEKIFDLEFRDAPEGMYPSLDPEVEPYEVFEKSSGEFVGVFMFDLYRRPGVKSGGAWMSQPQNRSEDNPAVVTFNMNFPHVEGALVDAGNIETYFHEGGHDMNGLLGMGAKHNSYRGVFNEIDAVEVPSMIFERWAFEPEVIKEYGFHHETGEPVPADLLARKEAASQFMGTADQLRMLQNARWDFAFHSMDPADYAGSEQLQRDNMLATEFGEHLRAYHLNRFDHLFFTGIGGYAASYGSYFVADVHSQHGFEQFKDHGLYDEELSARLKAYYAGGAGLDANKAYERMAGGPATPDAWLKSLGVDLDDDAEDPEPGCSSLPGSTPNPN